MIKAGHNGGILGGIKHTGIANMHMGIANMLMWQKICLSKKGKKKLLIYSRSKSQRARPCKGGEGRGRRDV